MAKEKATAPGMMQVLLQHAVYKPNQGRIARQVTFGAVLVLVLVAAWELKEFSSLKDFPFKGAEYVFSILFAAIGAWVTYRAVNYPRFADFLIAVEAELNKVSWPKRPELLRASGVVIFVIFFLTIVLWCFDIVWRAVRDLVFPG